MKRSHWMGAVAAALAAPLALTAQTYPTTPKVGGLVQVWYNQVLGSELRDNSAAAMGYYNLRSEFKEDGFNIRRTELNVSGSVLSGIDYYAMVDPSINTTSASTTNTNASYNPTILQDVYLTYHQGPFLVRLGQMKTLQTYEGNVGSSELLFAERSQLGRVFGDKRDRGAYASWQFGDAKEGFGVKPTLGVFNGMADLASGKAGDTNAQKDFVLRVDFNIGTEHRFGAYTLQGRTDQADKTNSALIARSFSGAGAPTAADALANKDKTTNYGAYYVFKSGPWYFDAEAITGLLGRRFASVTNTNTGLAALRDGLDQKFRGYYVTGAYTLGAHQFLVRYDYMNYNSNNNWYGANPYVLATGDFTPKYKETTLGYTYAFNPGLVKQANVKVNYIHRSKNFLKPTPGLETGEKGGDNLVAAVQVAF